MKRRRGLRGYPFLSRSARRRRALARVLGSFWFNALWFLFSTTPAQAEPISSAIAAFINVAFFAGFTEVTAAAVTAFAIKVAIVVGLSYVASSLSGSSKKSPGPQGVNGTLQGGGIVPRSFLVGRYATAGSLRYAGTYGTDGDVPNAYYTQVIVLSDLNMTALQEIWVGDKKGTYNTGLTAAAQGYPIAEFNANSKDNLWVRFYDGSQTTADSFLTSTFGSDPDYPYSSDMIDRGVAYVTVTARFNTEEFGGWPTYKFAGTGAKFYDPRLDSTNGGSGSHRFSDPSTWAYSENSIVIIYNILRGIAASTGQHLYGLEGLGAPRLPTSNWFAGMNECDAATDDLDGNSHAQYRCGAEISVDIEPAEIITALLITCNGRITEIGGVYKVLVGAPGSSVFSFTDDVIVVDQPQNADPFPSIDQAVNGIQATYTEATVGWDSKDLPIRVDQTAIDEDGENFATVNYALVIDPGQGQRLQLSALNEAQNHRRNALTLYPPAIVLEPLDVCAWTSPRNGYSSKAMLVNSLTLMSNLNVSLALSELDPADYDWDPDADPLDMDRPTLTPQGPPSNAPPSSLSAVGSVHSIALGWSNPANINGQVTEIWRSASSAFSGAAKIGEVALWGNRYIDSDLPTGNTYWYWIRYRRTDGTWSDYDPSSSGAGVSATTVQIDGSEIVDGSIDGIKFAESLPLVHPVASRAAYTSTYGAPSEGNLLVLTAADAPFAKGELLRFTDGAWTDAVPAVALVGPVTPGQLAAAYQGAALNRDPAPNDIKAWSISGGAAYFIGTLGIGGKVGTNALTITTNAGGGGVFSELVALDRLKTYRLHAWWQTSASGSLANGTTFIGIYLYDTSGAQIVTGGWPFNPVNGAAASTTWQEISTIFGAGTANTFPADAAYMGIQMYLNSGGTQGQQWAQDLRIEEVFPSTLIKDGAITNTKIADDSVSTPKLQANSVTTNELNAGAVTAAKIAANTITASQIAADTITGAQIAAGTITAGEIASNTITSSQIAANTITAGELAANSVTSASVAADAITAGAISAGAVNAGDIIVDNIIVTGKIVAENVTKVRSSGTNPGTFAPSSAVYTGSGMPSITEAYSGSPVLLTASIDFDNTDSGDHLFGVKIRRDGSDVYSQSARFVAPKSPNHFPFSISVVDASPGSGTHTYDLQFNGDSTNIRANTSTLTSLECKV